MPTVFAEVLSHAMGRGVIGAAVVNRDGEVIDWAGASADDEQSSLTNLVVLLEHHAALASLIRGDLGVLLLVDDELARRLKRKPLR